MGADFLYAFDRIFYLCPFRYFCAAKIHGPGEQHIRRKDGADANGDTKDLVIDKSGNFSIISEGESSIDSLDKDNIWQIFSFGPGLIEDGKVAVNGRSEVSQSMISNPRTAIGQISAHHYVIVVSDGHSR